MYGALNVGAARAQLNNTMNGKIMRLDPATGNGVGSTNFPNLIPNPYFDPQNPASAQSRLWVKGLRNPFRFIVRQDTPANGGPGSAYISDVGWQNWEELNIAKLRT